MKIIKNKKISLTDALCCFCAAALLLFMCEAFLPFKESRVYGGLIRLHIIANSDSKEDQNIKLAVRDELIKLSDTYLSSCKDIKEAGQKIDQIKNVLTDAADDVLRKNGFNYASCARIGKERYDTREYDGISFPKGEYLSLRVVLGNGEGKNWWCVLFPPLCLSAASSEKGLTDAGIDADSQKTFTSKRIKYRFRFKLLEWLFG